jgi:hypothetical protein
MVRNDHNVSICIWYEIVKSYADSTFILILHHIQINVIPKYMLHVGTVKSMYLKRKKIYTCIYTYYQFY